MGFTSGPIPEQIKSNSSELFSFDVDPHSIRNGDAKKYCLVGFQGLATVLKPDVQAINGLVHVVSAVLIPPFLHPR